MALLKSIAQNNKKRRTTKHIRSRLSRHHSMCVESLENRRLLATTVFSENFETWPLSAREMV